MAPESKNLRDVIKEEYKKCFLDPMYFMKKYVKIQHQTRGIIGFELYPFQEETLKDFITNDRNIVLKSRQMGISTLCAAYSLWTMIFNPGKNVLIISTKQDTSKEIVSKIRLANNNLPSWLRIQTAEDNRLSLKFTNESKVEAASSSSDSVRGKSAYLVILDECAFIDDVEAIWTSAQQTIGTGGRAILLSTPNGVGNFFHKMWVESEAKRNSFHTIKLKWNLHPERNQEWRDRQTIELGIKKASQECDTEFLSSGNTVVEIQLIEEYRKEVKEPVETRGVDHAYWIWDRPDYSLDYLISADVARGDGNDFSAFQVIDPVNLVQVAEYKGVIGTKEYGNMLVAAATEYNNALLVIENASYGWATIQQVIDRNYKNLFYSSADLQYVDVEQHITNKLNALDKKLIPGFTNSTKTRPLIINKLETCMRDKSFTIRSKRLLDELSTFVWNNGKAEAMRNYNDDLILSAAIGLWIRDTALRLNKESMSINRVILDGIRRTGITETTILKYSQNRENAKKSWTFELPGGARNKKETLNWLL
jgi:hypothetical protein